MRGRQPQHLRANQYFELQTFLGDNHSNSNCFGLQTVKPKVIWIANIQAQANVGCRRSNSIILNGRRSNSTYSVLLTFKIDLFGVAGNRVRNMRLLETACAVVRTSNRYKRQLVNRQPTNRQLVNRQQMNKPAVHRQPAQEATGEQAIVEQATNE